MDRANTQSGQEDAPSAGPVKTPSLKWEAIIGSIALLLFPATWLEHFLWGFGFDEPCFCCMNWAVRAFLLSVTRYIVLPISFFILALRLYVYWPFYNWPPRAIRLALLIAMVLPILWEPEPITPAELGMLGMKAKVAMTGGAANLQNWAVSTIEKASRDINDINDLNGQPVARHLWSEQVRKLGAINASFRVSDTGIPFIHITLAISWAPRGIMVGPPALQFRDRAPYSEFCPGVYGDG